MLMKFNSYFFQKREETEERGMVARWKDEGIEESGKWRGEKMVWWERGGSGRVEAWGNGEIGDAEVGG